LRILIHKCCDMLRVGGGFSGASLAYGNLRHGDFTFSWGLSGYAACRRLVYCADANLSDSWRVDTTLSYTQFTQRLY